MAKVTPYKQGALASSLVGTPGVDPSGAMGANTALGNIDNNIQVQAHMNSMTQQVQQSLNQGAASMNQDNIDFMEHHNSMMSEVATDAQNTLQADRAFAQQNVNESAARANEGINAARQNVNYISHEAIGALGQSLANLGQGMAYDQQTQRMAQAAQNTALRQAQTKQAAADKATQTMMDDGETDDHWSKLMPIINQQALDSSQIANVANDEKAYASDFQKKAPSITAQYLKDNPVNQRVAGKLSEKASNFVGQSAVALQDKGVSLTTERVRAMAGTTLKNIENASGVSAPGAMDPASYPALVNTMQNTNAAVQGQYNANGLRAAAVDIKTSKGNSIMNWAGVNLRNKNYAAIENVLTMPNGQVGTPLAFRDENQGGLGASIDPDKVNALLANVEAAKIKDDNNMDTVNKTTAMATEHAVMLGMGGFDARGIHDSSTFQPAIEFLKAQQDDVDKMLPNGEARNSATSLIQGHIKEVQTAMRQYKTDQDTEARQQATEQATLGKEAATSEKQKRAIAIEQNTQQVKDVQAARYNSSEARIGRGKVQTAIATLESKKTINGDAQELQQVTDAHKLLMDAYEKGYYKDGSGNIAGEYEHSGTKLMVQLKRIGDAAGTTSLFKWAPNSDIVNKSQQATANMFSAKVPSQHVDIYGSHPETLSALNSAQIEYTTRLTNKAMELHPDKMKGADLENNIIRIRNKAQSKQTVDPTLGTNVQVPVMAASGHMQIVDKGGNVQPLDFHRKQTAKQLAKSGTGFVPPPPPTPVIDPNDMMQDAEGHWWQRRR